MNDSSEWSMFSLRSRRSGVTVVSARRCSSCWATMSRPLPPEPNDSRIPRKTAWLTSPRSMSAMARWRGSMPISIPEVLSAPKPKFWLMPGRSAT